MPSESGSQAGGADNTVTFWSALADQLLSSKTRRRTAYVPPTSYTWRGFRELEVYPSPKFQSHSTRTASWEGVEPSRKSTVRKVPEKVTQVVIGAGGGATTRRRRNVCSWDAEAFSARVGSSVA